METPESYVIVKIGNVNPIYKVFATWRGGYLDGDRWKLNSGIAKIENQDDHTDFIGYSGSVYRCKKSSYGMSAYTQGVLDGMVKKAKEVYDLEVTILDNRSNWSTLLD